ncbi:SDR family NAD(P)-dependent oxidoreductase [Nocardia sp. SYP-A9097]|uniref:SDR family NAD(P)-dependent oxidoreductase n=1 Tax=Nocardia sp. SYP-A9097 TaxID=2663237 RepID=UPI001890B9AA|nr:SDR family NAD(P)-dependent oxidoreductase [Nocardia sp. SYP-A9097]
MTGASTGIGRATALRLTQHGFHVFATVRRAADGADLHAQAPDTLTPLIMDTTITDQIAEAAHAVHEHVGEQGLHVLVNNAGVPLFQSLEFLAPERLLHHMDVNVAGPLRVSQAFLPLLRTGAGRIIMIGSTSSWFVSPFGGSHSATKSALAALTEALRLELAAWNIDVVLIEPGAVHSSAFDKVATDRETAIAEMGAAGQELYGDAYRTTIDKMLDMGERGTDPDVIAEVVLRAASSSRPKRRYLAGSDARQLVWVTKLPLAILDSIQRGMFGMPKPGTGAVPTTSEAAGAK